MNNQNSPSSPTTSGRGTVVSAMMILMFFLFCFLAGIMMMATGSIGRESFGGIQIAGLIFFILSIGLVCTGIFLCLRYKKQREEYIEQTAGTQQMPVISGLPPPGSYGVTQPVQPHATATATSGTPYPPTNTSHTGGTSYPPEPSAPNNAPPPPSYEAAVMGLQPSAPSALSEEKNGM